MEESTYSGFVKKRVGKGAFNVYTDYFDEPETLVYRIDFNKVLTPTEDEQYAIFLYRQGYDQSCWVLGVMNKYFISLGARFQDHSITVMGRFDELPSLTWDEGVVVGNVRLKEGHAFFRLLRQCNRGDLKEFIVKSAVAEIASKQGSWILLLGELKLPMRFDRNRISDDQIHVVIRAFNALLRYGIPSTEGLLEAYVVNGITLKCVGDHYVIDQSVDVDMSKHKFRL